MGEEEMQRCRDARRTLFVIAADLKSNLATLVHWGPDLSNHAGE
jgi:hypothetical protein